LRRVLTTGFKLRSFLPVITGEFAVVDGQIGAVTNRDDEVNSRIDAVKAEVINRIDEVETGVSQQFSKVKFDMKSQINSVATEVDQLNEMHYDLVMAIPAEEM
jgi:hypothetical protein